MSQPMAQMYTIAEVAELTRMSEYWPREQCRQARVAHHRLGRNYRFSESDLAQLVEETRVQPLEQTLTSTRTLTPTRHRRR